MNRKKEILELLKDNDKDIFLNYALGLEYVADENILLAIQQFEKVISLDNEYIPAYYQCGTLYYQNGEKDKALTILRKGLKLAMNQQNTKSIAEFKSLITNIENDCL